MLMLVGPAVAQQGWVRVWGDEFDGPTIDDAKWRVEDLHLNKNNELEYYTPQDVYLENGDLVLRSRQRVYWGYDDDGNWRQFNYTSGLVDTRDRFAMLYGRLEVRAELPASQGMWPAHWMLPDSGGWPPEIDIMELLGDDPTRVYMTHHWGHWPNTQSDSGDFDGPDFSAGYHTFAIEWFADRIQWLVDDVVRFTSTTSVPQEPFYITLNTAVGGDWPGYPDGTTVFPQYHRIDYVRIYAWSGAGDGVEMLADTTGSSATADGTIAPGEYVSAAGGINSGLFDVIGENSQLHVDSSSDGRLNIGLESVSAIPSPYGVVIYIDAVDGGYSSTVPLTDTADRPRRLASGKGDAGESADLFFAPGFTADHAIVLLPNQARIFELADSSHVLVNGANLGDAQDINGGDEVTYVDDGAAGVERELELRLSHLGLSAGDSFRFVATALNGQNAFRSNEFVGVAPGNAWDAFNPGNTITVLKTGDFVEFTTAAPCSAACGVAGGDADFNNDCAVNVADLGLLLANYGSATATHADGDSDGDGDVDITDLGAVLSLFGVSCGG